MIVVFCDCGARFFVPEQHAGKRVKCRHCGGPIPVPLPGQEAENDAEAYAVEVEPDDKEEITIRDVVAAAPLSGAVAAAPLSSAPPAGGRLSDYLKDCAASLMFFAETGNLLRFVVVAIIAMLRPVVAMAPYIGLLAEIIIVGWIFSFLFNVLLNAAGGQDLPELNLLEGPAETIVFPFFKFLAAAAIVFWPVVLYGVMAPSSSADGAPVLWLLVGLGVFLWPMSMLIVGVGGVSSLARPDLIIQTLIRTIIPYVLVCLLTAGVVVASMLAAVTVFARSAQAAEHPFALMCALQVVGLYAWVLVMRIIGLYYHHFKQRFAWSWG